jgi:hypothetical protein
LFNELRSNGKADVGIITHNYKMNTTDYTVLKPGQTLESLKKSTEANSPEGTYRFVYQDKADDKVYPHSNYDSREGPNGGLIMWALPMPITSDIGDGQDWKKLPRGGYTNSPPDKGGSTNVTPPSRSDSIADPKTETSDGFIRYAPPMSIHSIPAPMSPYKPSLSIDSMNVGPGTVTSPLNTQNRMSPPADR